MRHTLADYQGATPPSTRRNGTTRGGRDHAATKVISQIRPLSMFSSPGYAYAAFIIACTYCTHAPMHAVHFACILYSFKEA